MYSSFDWPFFADFLAALEAAATPAALGAAEQAVWDNRGMIPFPPPYPNFVEGFFGVACSDSDNPDGHSFWSTAADDADAGFGYFGRIWTWASSACAVWNGADADRHVIGEHEGDPPEHLPLSDLVVVAQGLPNSGRQCLVVGHGAIDSRFRPSARPP